MFVRLPSGSHNMHLLAVFPLGNVADTWKGTNITIHLETSIEDRIIQNLEYSHNSTINALRHLGELVRIARQTRVLM